MCCPTQVTSSMCRWIGCIKKTTWNKLKQQEQNKK
jgi:hypothetical protein